MTSLPPRVVIVTRETEYELLLARHGTREAVRFHLETRGKRLDAVEARHHALVEAVRRLRAGLPRSWRQAAVRRDELDRFLFGPGDLIAAVGQDGLIANVAKYLDGQPVVGVNPDPSTIDGVLARISPQVAADVLGAVAAGEATVQARTMVQAVLDSGESLLALNEIFVGHRSHQSALYEISHGNASERQSSSGIIVTSGTGATGWARSIMESTGCEFRLDLCGPVAAFFVREAWPSNTTGTALTAGQLTPNSPLAVASRMDGGVIFADGIERDFLRFDWGARVSVRPAERTLLLVVE
ncbi:MAG: hypothetical protein ACK4SZ_03000 [Allosphingosinicella sp.]|uniref:hypothetical protein n=1 Tax=Allosphingosinicella sp. TaxID=2823234 RepID=UPI003963794F